MCAAESPSFGKPIISDDIHSKAEDTSSLQQEVIANGRETPWTGARALIRGWEQHTPAAPPPAHWNAGTSHSVAPGGSAARLAPAMTRRCRAATIDIDLIEPSPYHPRTRFRNKLWMSSGALHSNASELFIPTWCDRWEIAITDFCERRWRAAQRAGLRKSRRSYPGNPMSLRWEMTLVESIQREI